MTPLANVTCVWSPDPAGRHGLVQRMEEGGLVVHRPHGWVVGVRDFPGPTSTPATAAQHGVFFWEGREQCLPEDPDAAALRRAAASVQDVHRRAALPGDVTAALLRPGGATVVRSISGRVPLHVQRGAGIIVISDCVADVLRWSPLRCVADDYVTALWADGLAFHPEDRSFVRGTVMVRPGHSASITAESVRQDRYWRVPAGSDRPPTSEQRVERAEELRRILVEQLEWECDTERPSLLSVSGGLDSSVLAVLGHSAAQRSMAAATVFVSTTPAAEAFERSYVEQVKGSVPFARSHEWSESFQDLEDLVSAQPAPVPTTHSVLLRVGALAEQHGYRVYVGGEDADVVVGGWFTVTEWARTASWPTLLRRDGALYGRRLLLRARLRGDLAAARNRRLLWPHHYPLSGVFRRDLRQEWAQWLHEQVRRPPEDHPRAHLLHGLESSHGYTVTNWETCSRHRVRRAFPYRSRAALEWALTAHPDEQFGPCTKRALRLAMAGRMPEPLRLREKGNPELVGWQRPRAAWRSWSEATAALLDQDVLRRRVGEPCDPGDVLSVAALQSAQAAWELHPHVR